MIGVGLIGYGLGGRVFHAPFVRATDGLDLRAVVSRDAAKVHADLPRVAVEPDVAALLARRDIDLVIVSSPDALHAEHALAAIQAGKHVLVDKPFATSLAAARDVAAAADRAGVVVTAFQNRRWDADFLTLRRLVAEGRLGEIILFESRFDRWRPQTSDLWKEAREGGSWFDLGPHLVDQALCLLGRPRAITADIATFRPGAPAPDWFHVVLHYPRSRAILHSSKLTADHGLRFAVHGTGGSFIKHGLDPQEPAIVGGARLSDTDFGLDPVAGHYLAGDGSGKPIEIPTLRGDYGQFWRELADAIPGTGPNPVPASDAIEVIELLEAGMRSSRERRTITL